jgi:uncharacterized protein (TIGR02246 family)
MTMRNLAALVVILFGSVALYAQEQRENATENPAHTELRTLRDALLEAYEKRDVDGLLKHVHKDVVITWQNGERNRGREGLRAFYNKMMTGENRVVADLKSKLTIDELSVLYGDDTAVAFGELDDEFKLTNGSQFKLHSRWTATAVKEDDGWVIASFHVSANLFDNPVLNAATGHLATVGAVAGGIGLLIGIVVVVVATRVRKRKT